jgi:hypothetical protein
MWNESFAMFLRDTWHHVVAHLSLREEFLSCVAILQQKRLLRRQRLAANAIRCW